MEFDIKELTITLMVGAFTILGFEAILHYFLNKGLIGFFEGKLRLNGEGVKEQPFLTAVLVIFAFGLGVIVEDLSLKYVDSDNFPFQKNPGQSTQENRLFNNSLFWSSLSRRRPCHIAG